MPNIIAHCWYGDAAGATMADDELRSLIRRHHGVYMLGCQGPDFFYFYHRAPWQSQKHNGEVYRYANILHSEHPNQTFASLVKQVCHSHDEMAEAYVAGFLNHWALDSTAHPYIFYETGSVNGNVGHQHQIFETQIDKALLDANKLTIRDYAPKQLIRHPKGTAEMIWGLLKPLFQAADHLDLPLKAVSDSLASFTDLQGVFYDPAGTKYRLFSGMEKTFNLGPLATSMILPPAYDQKMDAMNYRRAEWHDPCDRTLVSHETFLDLGRRALATAKQALEIYARCLKGQAALGELTDLIGDRTFDTGHVPGREQLWFKADGN